MSLRCFSTIPKSSLVSELCECACVFFCWAPAELLLLFLPPKPRADSLSKQALSLPTDGMEGGRGKIFRADAVGLHFFFIHCGMPANKDFGFCFWKVDLREVKKPMLWCALHSLSVTQEETG